MGVMSAHWKGDSMKFDLMEGDCLDLMREIPDGSVDMVLCDLPYGTTQNKWDSVIPFEPLWAHYKRICKGAIVLTAAQPFTSALVMSNPKSFKYDYSWFKSNATGHLNAKKMPMRQHEDVLIFCFGRAPYHPQMFVKPSTRSSQRSVKSKGCYGDADEGVFRTVPDELGYPRSVVQFNTAYHDREAGLHPTQKPVALMEYLIRTYTNEGETVLDNCMGSGTTGVACMNTKRKFIGIEQDAKYFDIACDRIENALA
jgi:site-specific DNA-methyltransferase (adenine-specific)